MPMWFSSSGIPNIVGAFRSSSTQTLSTTVFTFTNLAIGTAETLRNVVVGLTFQSANPGIVLSSLTIGGVSATQIGALATPAGGPTRFALIAGAIASSGTTATIVATMSTAAFNMGCAVYSINNAVRALGTASITSGADAPGATVSFGVTGGFAVACVASGAGAVPPTASWSGLTENVDANYGSSNLQVITCASLNATTSGSVTSTCTITTPSGGSCGNFVVFTP